MQTNVPSMLETRKISTIVFLSASLHPTNRIWMFSFAEKAWIMSSRWNFLLHCRLSSRKVPGQKLARSVVNCLLLSYTHTFTVASEAHPFLLSYTRTLQCYFDWFSAFLLLETFSFIYTFSQKHQGKNRRDVGPCRHATAARRRSSDYNNEADCIATYNCTVAHEQRMFWWVICFLYHFRLTLQCANSPTNMSMWRRLTWSQPRWALARTPLNNSARSSM